MGGSPQFGSVQQHRPSLVRLVSSQFEPTAIPKPVFVLSPRKQHEPPNNTVTQLIPPLPVPTGTQTSRDYLIATYGLDVAQLDQHLRSCLLAVSGHALQLLRQGDTLTNYRYSPLQAWTSGKSLLQDQLPFQIGRVVPGELNEEELETFIRHTFAAVTQLILSL